MSSTALITGAARGIGYGIAQELAACGFNLLINDIVDAEYFVEKQSALEQYDVKVQYCQANIGHAAARQQLLEKAVDAFGSIEVLVNNAGIAPDERVDILHATEETFRHVMNVNLQGPYFLTQALARQMIEDRKNDSSGRFRCIINIASSNSELASTNRGEYCISKAGVSMATKLWATRLAEFNICVYEIRPGIIETSMTRPVKETYDRFIAEGGVLQRRWGQPKDVGKIAASLARGNFPYSTGQVIRVDGGLMLPHL